MAEALAVCGSSSSSGGTKAAARSQKCATEQQGRGERDAGGRHTLQGAVGPGWGGHAATHHALTSLAEQLAGLLNQTQAGAGPHQLAHGGGGGALCALHALCSVGRIAPHVFAGAFGAGIGNTLTLLCLRMGCSPIVGLSLPIYETMRHVHL